MNNAVGDIVFFKNYYFTDDPSGVCKPHYAIVLLPDHLTQFANNVYCAVIMSQRPREGYCLQLEQCKYSFFEHDSYIAFARQDYEALSDLHSGVTQPVGHLIEADFKVGFKILKASLYNSRIKTINPHTRATILREWKKVLHP